MKNRLSAFTLVLIFSHLTGFSQSVDSLRAKYPGEPAVMLNKNMELDITVQGGAPHVEGKQFQQIEYLKPISEGAGRYGFYQSDFQQIVTYEAFTRTPNDKKIKVNDYKTKASSEDFVFYDDVRETTFSFPSVGIGAVGNLSLSWINKNPYLLSPFYFAGGIPALNSELDIHCPENMEIGYQLRGGDTTSIVVEKTTRHHRSTYVFRYRNCPAITPYDDNPGTAWIVPQVVFFIKGFEDEKGNHVAGLGGLDDLYRLSYGFVRSINQSISPELTHITDSLVSGIPDSAEKSRRIYNWVQGHIKYIAFEQGMEGFVPREASLVCSRRYGDCKDMASILTGMLRHAGIPAYYTWIGTRHLPYRFTDLPLPLVSNHMICTIRLNGKDIFLDATDPTCLFGMPSEGIQDKEAMLAIDEKNYRIRQVPVPDKSVNRFTDSTWLELTPEGISGRTTQTMTGYYAMRFNGRMMYLEQTSALESMRPVFRRGSNRFALDSFTVLPLAGDHGDARIAGYFHLPGYAKSIGNEWFINLNLQHFFEHEEIDYPKRKTPIAFPFLSQRRYVTMLHIPDGYESEGLPVNHSFHNDVWGFDISYERKGNYIILTQQLDNDYLLLEPSRFEAWNKVLEKLLPTYKETLNLKKTAHL